jgi:hypothetical protein
MADVSTPPGALSFQEQLDLMIDDIDRSIAGKYVFTLRDLLENPDDYAETPDVDKEIDKLKKDVSAYFDDMISGASEQVTKYKDDAMKSTRLAEKFEGVLMDKVKSAKKPFVSPFYFVRKEDDDEIIFIDNYDTAYEGLLEELLKSTMFVVNTSIQVDTFKMGRWVFVGENKNRGISIFFPVNPTGVLEMAKEQLAIALDGVKLDLEAAAKAKEE